MIQIIELQLLPLLLHELHIGDTSKYIMVYVMPKMKNVSQKLFLPHDWLIYDTKNLYWDSVGWYRKKIEVDRLEGHIIIRFEAVYMNATIFVNGMEAGCWKYGYSTFDIDISNYAKA